MRASVNVTFDGGCVQAFALYARLGSDAQPGRYEAPRGFAMTVDPPTIAEAHALFAALAEGGRVAMPIQQTFWAAAFGLVVDRFGIAWAINCEAPPA
jgi:PhnB protein